MALTTYDYNVYIIICQPRRLETCAYGFWAKNNILIPETRINKGFQFFKKQKFAYSAQTQVYAPPQNGVTHSKWERTGELSGHLERFPDLPDRDVWGQLTYFLAVRSGGNPPDNRSFSPLLQRAGGWGEIKYFNLSIKHPHLYHLYDSSSVISSGMNPTPLRPAASSLFLSVSLTIRSIPSLRMNNSLSLGINERFMITL